MLCQNIWYFLRYQGQFPLYIGSIDLFDPFPCNLHDIVFDWLESHAPFPCPTAKTIYILLKFQSVLCTYDFAITNAVVNKQPYLWVNVCCDIVNIQREQQWSKKGALRDTWQNGSPICFYTIAAWNREKNLSISKSESLLISRKANKPYHAPLLMNNGPIKEVTSYKHLGIFLSSDGTWHEHTNYITAKAWIRINVMRKLKFLLDRHSLVEIIYISVIRPHLEYADVVWNNCTKYKVNVLEKIQLEAARIVTGATKLVSLEILYNETGWKSLETRRSKHKMCLFYKMNKSSSPNYISSLVHNLLKQPCTIVYTMQQIYDNLFRGHNCITIRFYPLILDYHYGTIFRLKWENQIRTQIINIKLIRIYGNRLNSTWLETDSLRYNVHVSELLAVPWTIICFLKI